MSERFHGWMSALIGAAVLAGCAGATTPPAVVQPISADAASMHVVDIAVDTAPGVFATDQDRAAIRDKIRNVLSGQPQGENGATPDSSYKMKVTLTRFDEGNAVARLALIGLGQIHIEGTVDLTDPSGKPAGSYKITKAFAVGGLVGGLTTTEQVEDGFAKSVGAGLTAKK